jgi:hypothetical protein
MKIFFNQKKQIGKVNLDEESDINDLKGKAPQEELYIKVYFNTL